jgi:hypothetical protein
MIDTPQQRAFKEALRSSASSIALIARAGSGKTTTMVSGAKEADLTGLAVAFNKSIAVTLEKRMPSTVVCKTLNGLGHTTWGRHLSKRLILNNEKIFQLAGKHVPGDLKRAYQAEWMRLANMFRTLPILPIGAPGVRGEDSEEVWRDLIDEFDCDFGDLRLSLVIDVARKIILDSIKLAWQGEVDFTDQIYMPVVYRSAFERFPVVLGDEAQDWSLLQHEMIARSTGERLLMVGDPRQAIYAWRGASSESMAIMGTRMKCVEMPLTVSFRCAKAVIRAAQRYVPDIEHTDNAPEGSVLGVAPWSKRVPQSGDWVVCRNNRPLVWAFFQLAKQGIPALIRGRSIGISLAKLVDKIKACDSELPLNEFSAKLSEWRQRWTSHYAAQGKDAKAADCNDRAEVLECLIENATGTGYTTQDLKNRILRLFSDENGAPVTLSTIHKAKGLEAKRVHFLDSHLLPSKWAKGDALKQEDNLAYVAITRAQEELSYLDTEDDRS